ncbi:carbonic anhydrase family protein [Ureibacillus sp. Re31]|uniref:Carbonic anhydrase family protein n=1 Tax=Ureibacillus galli TaxID=2762222 RepID=A0ABR8XH07_9BACL|nr:carbonic anhydrase family protein [Ureibacillus galli]
MRRSYIYAFLVIAIAVVAVSYLVNPPIEQAPIENEQQLTAKEGASSNVKVNESNELLNVNSNYEACGKGTLQSPINIEVKETIDEEQALKLAEQISLNYDQALFAVENNGHTIEANSTTLDNSLLINDKEFKLTGIHFHSPSEH